MALRFRTEVELHGKTATGLTVPDEIVEQLSGGKRVKVLVTIAKHSYRTTVAPMGGKFLIPLAAENREAAGVSAGDVVEVTIAPDEAPREVELPDDLAAAIGANGPAREFFNGLSFTYRKEWVRWVTEAKKPETRTTRIEKTVEALKAGKKTK
jgi:Bacteriocin-protection, YdeI or OmpD-Associated/Domain of unknown function (DUF1905)